MLYLLQLRVNPLQKRSGPATDGVGVKTAIRMYICAMELAEIRALCLKLPAVTEDIKWENHLCFNVGEKMFVVTAPDDVPVSASIKVSEEDFARLCSRSGIRPAPYLARYHWVYVDDISRLSKKEWRELVAAAHQLISSKLPKSTRKKLGLDRS
jgi:predicted DNA-binding protein (MmcQ/YjbR family)